MTNLPLQRAAREAVSGPLVGYSSSSRGVYVQAKLEFIGKLNLERAWRRVRHLMMFSRIGWNDEFTTTLLPGGGSGGWSRCRRRAAEWDQ